MPETLNKNLIKGGEFIIRDSKIEDIFIPEEVNEEQKMIIDMVLDFIDSEIKKNWDKIERQEDNIASSILEKAGELGLLGPHMPMQYGGMELDTNTNTLINDYLGPAGSITVSLAVQTGIGMLPILYFGTDAQKEKYLPKLISGAWKTCYCLTEPSSGSDALSAKTRADLDPSGEHYILNGQKMWISNSGFADIFIVFAQVDGDKFTGFIVEKEGAEGLTLGAEEHKLGIHGSSTRQVFFENVRVSKDQVLGEIGKGHLLAFNALNIGRFKLGAMCIGGSKVAIGYSVRYANERKQFKQPISNFGAIKSKLAEMTIGTYASEAALYRVSQMMQDKKEALLEDGASYAEAAFTAANEFAIECAILKVLGSEVSDFVVDENLQIHGGIGFSEEHRAAQVYRDNRINRIYEGTNEINRLLMVQMMFKKAMKGQLDLVGPAWAVQKELASVPSFGVQDQKKYEAEIKAVKEFKKIILVVAGAVAKMQMDGQLDLKEEQEIVMNIADMMIQTFTAESLLLRVQKMALNEKALPQEVYDAMLYTFIHDTNSSMQKWATDALASFAEGDLLRTFLMGVKRFTKYPAVNVKVQRRIVAAELIKANGYCF